MTPSRSKTTIAQRRRLDHGGQHRRGAMESGFGVAHPQQRADVGDELAGSTGSTRYASAPAASPSTAIFHLHDDVEICRIGMSFGAFAALQSAGDVEAVNVGQVDVEEHEIGLLARRRAAAPPPRLRPRSPQSHPCGVYDRARNGRGVVVDDEDPRSVRAQAQSGGRFFCHLVGQHRAFKNSSSYSRRLRVHEPMSLELPNLLSRHESEILRRLDPAAAGRHAAART